MKTMKVKQDIKPRNQGLSLKDKGGSVAMPTTRQEHMQWCKQRALEYLKPGPYFSPSDAVASMLSDLGKHEETRQMLEKTNAITSLAILSATNATEAKRFIEGFA